MYYYSQSKKRIKSYLKNLLGHEMTEVNSESFYFDFGIINPSIGSTNLGDLIILDSILMELKAKYPNELFTHFPSQIGSDSEAKRLMATKEYLFVSGTNLLSSNMDTVDQWKLDPGHKTAINNKVILCGVGWWQYQKPPNRYTKGLLKSVLSDRYIHSVRDSYTLDMLNGIGIDNVVNTSCPTLWSLNSAHCSQIPHNKSQKVITTLTFYKANPELDRRMLDILIEKYEIVYLWVQGLADIQYLKSIYGNLEKIRLVPPTVEAYNRLLDDQSIDYIGTRLHAGIRAIQKRVRTLILAVDNRAYEIAKDTNLNVIKRQNIDEMMNFIENEYVTNITLPINNIARWRSSLPKKEG